MGEFKASRCLRSSSSSSLNTCLGCISETYLKNKNSLSALVNRFFMYIYIQCLHIIKHSVCAYRGRCACSIVLADFNVHNRGKSIYQSPLKLTELFQHNLNKRFLSHGMLPLSGHDDDALFD